MLYGLHSSRTRWHKKVSDYLRGMGFFPYKVDTGIWMRQSNGLREYIVIYADDLVFGVRYPKTVITLLK